MILESMTKEEVFKQLKADIDWLDGRTPGLKTKYNKHLKDKRVGHKSILGVSSYLTPNHNRVQMLVQKAVFGKLNSLCFSYLFEFTGGNGKKRYLYPLFVNRRLCDVVVFSNHCMSRMMERSGLTSTDLLRALANGNDGAMNVEAYEYKGEKRLLCSIGNYGGVICSPCAWGIIGVTYINLEQHDVVQVICHQETQSQNEEVGREHFNEVAAYVQSTPRYMRRGLVRA